MMICGQTAVCIRIPLDTKMSSAYRIRPDMNTCSADSVIDVLRIRQNKLRTPPCLTRHLTEKTSPRRTLLFYSTVGLHVSSLDQCCRSFTKTTQRPLLFTKRPEFITGTLWNDLRAPSDTQYTLTPFCVIREISYWFYNVKRTWLQMLNF